MYNDLEAIYENMLTTPVFVSKKPEHNHMYAEKPVITAVAIEEPKEEENGLELILKEIKALRKIAKDNGYNSKIYYRARKIQNLAEKLLGIPESGETEEYYVTENVNDHNSSLETNVNLEVDAFKNVLIDIAELMNDPKYKRYDFLQSGLSKAQKEMFKMLFLNALNAFNESEYERAQAPILMKWMKTYNTHLFLTFAREYKIKFPKSGETED